jgi:hypothetical protein
VTQTRNRPGVASGAAPKAVIATTTSSAIVTLVLPPAGKRRFAVGVVAHCPFCGRPHLHRGHQLDGAVRAAGCSGREYVLAVRR